MPDAERAVTDFDPDEPPDPTGSESRPDPGRPAEPPDPFDPFQDALPELPEPTELVDDETNKDESFLGFLYELPILILVALVVAVVIKTFLIQAFFIPSGSMIPTLQIDDRVMVNKLAYTFGDPSPGDIIVFDSPFQDDVIDESLVDKVVRNVAESLGLRTANAEDLIKRIIATGGDIIEIRDNTVVVNGVALDEPYLTADSDMADMEAREIPQGTVWVMGDNRSRSQDSRRFGPIDESDIIGRAFIRMWPFDRFGGL